MCMSIPISQFIPPLPFQPVIPGENPNPKRCMHPNIHCSTSAIAKNGSNLNVHGLDKDVVYAYNGILLSHNLSTFVLNVPSSWDPFPRGSHSSQLLTWLGPATASSGRPSLTFLINVVLPDGTRLQYSCLENPTDGGAWWAAVHGVAKSRTRLSDFTFTHWRRKWQPTPVLLPGESQGWGSLVGCRLWGRTESDTTEAT